MRDYIYYDKQELLKNAKVPVEVLATAQDVFTQCAMDMAHTVEQNNSRGDITVMVIPIGPTGQYPIFAEYVNKTGLSLKNCYFALMDEYIEDGKELPYEHRLSLSRKIDDLLYNRLLPELAPPQDHRLKPHAANVMELPKKLQSLGKIDLCVAGIGINGHIGMNEQLNLPIDKYLQQATTRILDISTETRVICAINNYKGAVCEVPLQGITLGLKEMLTAKKLRVYCFRDWHNTAVKRAVCEQPSGNYPSTAIQLHNDIIVYTHEEITQAI